MTLFFRWNSPASQASRLPYDRKKILEFKNIESICIEILVGNNKWLISGVYRPQTINDKTFNDDFIKTCDKITTNMIILCILVISIMIF